MSPPWDALPRGVQLFNQGLYYEAHEAWEELWLELSDEPRVFLQGLIQVAAAGHKAFAQRQPRGCVMLLRAALDKLDGAPAGLLGVETGRFVAGVRRTLIDAEAWLAGERTGPGSFPQIDLLPEK
ncbi:MAG TPA: DUF309 domain-containing protein [Myxococcales bacterium]|nr:DUF309 domain-containing protein [Myxococcales bacterium]